MVARESGTFDVVVIGGGPAGLFCALQVASSGLSVAVLEKNPSCGRKLLISGSGQCNITHTGTPQEFLSHYGDHGKFLKPALFSFPPKRLIAFFSEHATPLEAGDDGKFFPVSRKSSDILNVLLKVCTEKGVTLLSENPVQNVRRSSDLFIIESKNMTVTCEVLVISTGGKSYPATGSTGDGYRLAGSLGQPVTPVVPALTPLNVRDYPFSDLAGISLPGAVFSLYKNGVQTRTFSGDILFTHTGLSGPGILDASRFMEKGDELRVSFVGKVIQQSFERELRERLEKSGKHMIRTVISSYPVPERLLKRILEAADIDQEITCAHVTAEMRRKIVRLLTEYPFYIENLGDFSVAMATRGGIELSAVHQNTLESRVVPGLFFCGEVLDIDGDTGGYNLQTAFSTGYLAAQGIVRKLKPLKKD